MSEYIRLPRSALSEELWRNKEYGCLLWFLLSRTDHRGVATFTASDIEMRLGISRQRLRTMLGKIQKSGLATSIQPTSNQQATNIIFDFQCVVDIKQPTSNQQATNKSYKKNNKIHPSHRHRSSGLRCRKKLSFRPCSLCAFLSEQRMDGRPESDERLESLLQDLGDRMEKEIWRKILL